MWSLPSDPPRGVILTPNDCKILDFAKLSEPRVGWALVPKSATDCHLVLATRTARCSSDRENQSNKKASFVDIKLKFILKPRPSASVENLPFIGLHRPTLANSLLFSVTFNPPESR